jgi:transcriptional regulator
MDLVRGSVDALILGALRREDAHGYRIAQALRERSDGLFDLPEGTVYPALHRLERRGLIASRWAVEGGRRRRVYALTDGGRRALDDERASWRSFARAVEAVLA